MIQPAKERKAEDLVEERVRNAKKWLKAIEVQVLHAARNGGYGNLVIEIFNGHIKRGLLQRSVTDPDVFGKIVEPEEVARLNPRG